MYNQLLSIKFIKKISLYKLNSQIVKIFRHLKIDLYRRTKENMNTFNISEIVPFIQQQKFSQGIGQLTYLIEGLMNSSTEQIKESEVLSTLFLNRGIMEIYEGRLDQSLGDLQRSLDYNHLNYAAYFNISAVKYMSFERVESFKQLCCSLSCLYLLRGRLRNTETDINKSLKYCENNLEARIAKSLNFVKKGKYKLALNEIKWVLELNPHDEKGFKICQRLQKLLEVDSEQSFKNSDPSQQQLKNSHGLRLSLSMFDDEELEKLDIEKQIASKMVEFNNLYTQVNGQPCLFVDQTSPKTFLLYKNLNIQNLIGLQVPQKLLTTFSAPQPQHEQNEIKNQKLFANKNKSSDSIDRSISKKYIDNFGEISSVRLSEDPQLSRYNQNNTSLESGVTLQFDGDKKLSIKVLKIDILNKQQKFPQISQNNLYCLFEYGTKEFKSQLFSVGEDNRSWQDQFQAQLSKQPQILIIKLFHKQLTKFNDTLLGQGDLQIQIFGQFYIPIYRFQKRNSPILEKSNNFLGNVLIQIKYK